MNVSTDIDPRAEAAIAFCAAQDYPLGVALIAHRWRNGSADDVVAALSRYQNADGGFGNGLEVDIAAMESNPFATRLAMQVLLALTDRPTCAETMLVGIDRYLTTAQDEVGDFRFAPEVLAAPLAPWFAGWTFPNLNPAACLAGLAFRLGIGAPELFARVRAMMAALGSIDQARDGAFYEVLPYVEYAPLFTVGGKEAMLAAIAEGIITRLQNNGYEDAGHALDHALGGGTAISARIPADLLAQQASRLVAEQGEDGGWPSPYSAAWRPWVTAMSLVQLTTLRDM